jgi:hypothetical protein
MYSYHAYFTESCRYCSAILLIVVVTDFAGLSSTDKIVFKYNFDYLSSYIISELS